MFELYKIDHDLDDETGRYYGLIIREKMSRCDDTLYYYIRAIYDKKFKDIHALWTSSTEPDSLKYLAYKSSSEIIGWVCPVRASYDKSVYEFKKVYLKDKENYDKKIEMMIVDSML